MLDASGPPALSLDRWTFTVEGAVAQPKTWNWVEFQQLPRVQVFADFHCVTRWSRLGNIWEGVSTRLLMELAGGGHQNAKYVLVHGHDSGWTTNVVLSDLQDDDALVATRHDGEPLTVEHGGPSRLILPRLYAWKSAKWVAKLDVREKEKAGFWERNGYHMHGDPWKEERHGW